MNAVPFSGRQTWPVGLESGLSAQAGIGDSDFAALGSRARRRRCVSMVAVMPLRPRFRAAR
jgi:hypothetical protein